MSTRDRYGDVIEDQTDDSGDRSGLRIDVSRPEITPEEHRCDDGWIDRDSNPAIPCLTCRPHLTPTPPKPRPPLDVAIRGSARCRAALHPRRTTP